MESEVLVSLEKGEDAARSIIEDLSSSPDLLLLFPTTLYVESTDFKSFLEILNEELDSFIVGGSTGGMATHSTDGFETRGVAAVALNNISFSTERVANVWSADSDYLRDLLEVDAGTTMVFGVFGRSTRDTTSWNTVKALTNKVIEGDILGQRERVARKISDILDNNEFAYTNLLEEKFIVGREDRNIIGYPSGDSGKHLKGYEIWQDQYTDSKSGGIIYLDQKLDKGVFKTTNEVLEDRENVMEILGKPLYEKDVIYDFEDFSLSDLKEEYSVFRKADEGGLNYYIILEGDGYSWSVPLSEDLSAVINFVDMNEDMSNDVTAYLARSPGWKTYIKVVEDEIKKLNGLQHITINPPQIVSYEANINDIIETIDEEMEEYIFTVSNTCRNYQGFNYMYPGYVKYE